MSDLYNSLYRRLEPKRYDRPGDMPMDKIELGLVFEEEIERSLKQRLASDGRPEQFSTKVDNTIITFSPDLLLFEDGITRLGEIKLTWMSARGAPISKEQAELVGRPDIANDRSDFDHKFEKWFTQMRAYCYHLGLLDAKLIVFFVLGIYKPPTSIPPLAWDISFTQQELDEEWAALYNHGKAEGLIK